MSPMGPNMSSMLQPRYYLTRQTFLSPLPHQYHPKRILFFPSREAGCKVGRILEGSEIRPNLFSAISAGLSEERTGERPPLFFREEHLRQGADHGVGAF